VILTNGDAHFQKEGLARVSEGAQPYTSSNYKLWIGKGKPE